MVAVTVIGAGLAGSEAAWQIAQQGIKVNLYEMRPVKTTPAHKTDLFGELVCSNSFRAAGLENAVGLLKEEMRYCHSIFMECADLHQIPAGSALAVDREKFATCLTQKISAHPLITVKRQEVSEIDGKTITVIATGPLTEGKMAETIRRLTGEDYLYFYDAAAPIVTKDSIDMEKVFWASRYNKGEADYLNCPLTKEEYDRFYQELISAEVHPLKEFEQEIYFEGCMPIEVMARRGKQTLLFGPLKPVGLIDPRTQKQPYAVVQLRKDNQEGTLFNMVGFQTHLKWGEQKRVFSLIPGLEEAEFVRYGVMHRNTFVNSPKVLKETGQLKRHPNVFLAGQITGVEGYVESAAAGLIAGLNAGRLAKGKELLTFPPETALASLFRYITQAESKNFQPMNINFGLLPPLKEKIKDKRLKNKMISQRSLQILQKYIEERGIFDQ